MFNVKPEYKTYREPNFYDRNYDSYCSLVPLTEFKQSFENLIQIASWKRDNLYRYNIEKRM